MLSLNIFKYSDRSKKTTMFSGLRSHIVSIAGENVFEDMVILTILDIFVEVFFL